MLIPVCITLLVIFLVVAPAREACTLSSQWMQRPCSDTAPALPSLCSLLMLHVTREHFNRHCFMQSHVSYRNWEDVRKNIYRFCYVNLSLYHFQCSFLPSSFSSLIPSAVISIQHEGIPWVFKAGLANNEFHQFIFLIPPHFGRTVLLDTELLVARLSFRSGTMPFHRLLALTDSEKSASNHTEASFLCRFFLLLSRFSLWLSRFTVMSLYLSHLGYELLDV